jgi:hypothetical protein
MRSIAVLKLRPAPVSLMLAVVAILPVLSTLPPVRIFLACGRFWLPIIELIVVSPEPPPCLKCLLIEIFLEALDSLRVWLEGGDVGV